MENRSFFKDLDGWIEQLKQCKPLEEGQVKLLCEKVGRLFVSRRFIVRLIERTLLFVPSAPVRVRIIVSVLCVGLVHRQGRFFRRNPICKKSAVQ